MDTKKNSNPNMVLAHDDGLIAGWKTAAEWRRCQAGLQVGGDPKVWGVAFDDFFITRLDLRYRNPIKMLQKGGRFQGEGFSILTIQCSLIEYFESTIQGIKYRFTRNGQDLGKWEYSKSQEVFVEFLTNRPPFDSEFDQPLAEDFYRNVRCGLLHEARTKDGWRVRARGPNNEIIDGKGKLVFRDGFQVALDKFVDWYSNQLVTDPAMQQAFIRKFDDLCT